MAKDESLYTFETTEEYPTVKIDGEKYPFRLGVSYRELIQLKDIGERIQAIADNPARTEEDEAELSVLLRESTNRMVELPDEIDEKLTDLHRFRITGIFNDLVQERIGNPTKVGGKT